MLNDENCLPVLHISIEIGNPVFGPLADACRRIVFDHRCPLADEPQKIGILRRARTQKLTPRQELFKHVCRSIAQLCSE
jgi:hypothetical protein